MSSSNLFQEYESQYCTVSTSVAHTLESLHTLSNNDIKVSKVKQIERQLKDVEPTLQRLDMEARSSPGPQSVVLVRKAKEYRKDWQKLMLDVKRVASDVSHDQVANRSELLHEYQTTSQQQRDRLLSATEQLQQTGDTIREGGKQLLETEELGVAVLSDLQRQRESIMHSRETLSHVDANVGKARQVLATMSRRITQNKLIMYGVIALLVGCIGLLIWAKLT